MREPTNVEASIKKKHEKNSHEQAMEKYEKKIEKSPQNRPISIKNRLEIDHIWKMEGGSSKT